MNLLIVLAGFHLDVITVYMGHVLGRCQRVDGLVTVRRVSVRRRRVSDLLPIVTVDALRALELKRRHGPRKNRGLIRPIRARCLLGAGVATGAQHRVLPRDPRGRLIVLYGQHSCNDEYVIQRRFVTSDFPAQLVLVDPRKKK